MSDKYNAAKAEVAAFETTDVTEVDANGNTVVVAPSLATSKSALEDAMVAASTNPALSQDEKIKVTAYQNKFSACVTACQDNVTTARTEADSQLDAYQTVRNNHSDAIAGCSQAQTVLSTVALVKPLISVIMGIHTLVQKSKHMVYMLARWGEARDSMSNAGFRPRHLPPHVDPASPCHVIGANNSTEVYGKEDVLVWGDKATLFGIGTKTVDEIEVPDNSSGEVHVHGAQQARLSAGDTCHIASGDKLKLNATDLTIEAVNTADSEGELTIMSKKKTSIEAQEDDLALSAPFAGKKITLEAEADIKADTKTLTMTTTEATVIQTAAGGGNAKLAIDSGGTIDAQTGRWKVGMKKASGVKAGKDGGAELVLANGKAALDFKGRSKVTLTAQKGHAKAPKWTVIASSGAVNLVASGGNVKINGKKILLG